MEQHRLTVEQWKRVMKEGSMPKDLRGKTVSDLEQEDFEKLFCRQCVFCGICDKDLKNINLCRGQIDSGAWDRLYRKRKSDRK